ncbi:hypothetical protein N7470_005590 [Penicillium chermesinum]|nr:hypothetical protein N7470_005590 [Penicillium chermesinum]
MEFKRRRLASPQNYNPLPIPESDLATPTNYGLFSTRIVETIHTSQITPENEQLVRTWHPALKGQDPVHVSHPQYGPEVWLVEGEFYELAAGGRYIHPYPGDQISLYPHGILTPRSPWKEEYLFKDGINPRKLLSTQQLDNLRTLFPHAVGARVLVSGFLVVLYSWGLRTFYDISKLEPTAGGISSGMQVSTEANSANGLGCIGLRVRMVDGEEAITTVTHGFVRNPQHSRVVLKLADWISKTKSALQRFRRPKPQPNSYAVGVTRDSQVTSLGSNKNSPIGKDIWLATEQTRIGTITQTFDKPSEFLPYPAGYKHDLSLITGAGLPEINSPPGYPVITGWAQYSDALDGTPVFATRLNASTSRWGAIEGSIDIHAIQRASTIGAQYLWDSNAYLQTASLLWVANESFTPAVGWLGCPLCLGEPTDQTVSAVVFQNFQVTRRSGAQSSNPRLIIVKGGFLLPEAIRSSTVVVADQHRHRPSDTFPRRSREAPSSDRRLFSNIN